MPCAAIDLFCGVGGLTKGLEQAGINVVAGIDFEASCQYAYEENNNANVIDEIQNIWRDYKVKEVHKPDSKLSTYTNRVQNIVLDITQNTPLILSKSMIGVDGNLNAEKIKKICDKHKIRYRVVDDQLALEKVRKKRNALAHGDESFSRCARDLTISDLGIIKDTVIRFISEIVEGMEKYCNEKQYLRAQ